MTRRTATTHLLQHCPALQASPPAGVALFATTTHDGSPALTVLVDWREAGSFHPHAEPVPVIQQAHRAVRRAADLGWSSAPCVRVRRPPRYPYVYRVVDHCGALEVLDGPSIGLAAAWAAASWVSQIPPPPNVAVIGALEPRGDIVGVGGVTAKATMLREAGVTHLWTASANLEEAQAVLPATAVDHLQALVEGTLEIEAAQDWPKDQLQHLLHWCLSGSPMVIDWAPFARTFAHIRTPTPSLAYAQRIVARHLDATQASPRPEDLSTIPRPLRLKRIAHHLQDHTDHGSATAEEEVQWALGFLAKPLERTEGDYLVLGAAGRLLASGGHLDEGWALLWLAAEGLQHIDQPERMGHSVCALLWVASVTPIRPDWVRESRRLAARYELEDLPGPARDYLSLAQGRLDIRTTGQTPRLHLACKSSIAHVRNSAIRWARRAGDPDRWPQAGTDFRLLAELDERLSSGDDTRSVLEQLKRQRPGRFEQVTQGETLHLARQIADAWPY